MFSRFFRRARSKTHRNVRGRLQQIGVMTFSKSGVAMRSALLADPSGTCLPLMLRDGHASEEYQEGEEVEEVIMYHCVSQSVGFG